MLLYRLPIKKCRVWCLDLAAPGPGLGDPALPSVYALVVPSPPPAGIYIGATADFRSRVTQHLTRAGTARRRRRGPGDPPQRAIHKLLAPVLSGRSALLVIRLETAPGADAATLEALELAWMVVAARAELALAARRGPRIQWAGDPSQLRRAFALARTRSWPGRWVTALTPLCKTPDLPARALPRQWTAGAATPAGRRGRRRAARRRDAPDADRPRPGAKPQDPTP